MFFTHQNAIHSKSLYWGSYPLFSQHLILIVQRTICLLFFYKCLFWWVKSGKTLNGRRSLLWLLVWNHKDEIISLWLRHCQLTMFLHPNFLLFLMVPKIKTVLTPPPPRPPSKWFFTKTNQFILNLSCNVEWYHFHSFP